MFVRNLLTAFVLGITPIAAALSYATSCGLGAPPCLDNQYCKSFDDTCADIATCAGYCEYLNAYAPCTGSGEASVGCRRPREHCVDDPRIEGTCGMACGRPGICVNKRQTTCGGDKGEDACPPGFSCFLWSEDGTLVVGGGDGICLYA